MKHFFLFLKKEKKHKMERKNNTLFFEFIAVCSSVEVFKKACNASKTARTKPIHKA